MRVLFVNPPFKGEHGRFSREQRSPAITRGGTLYYPMWLCYAAGVLEQDGFEVRIIDAPARRLDDRSVLATAGKFAPALVVVDTSTPSIAADADMAGRLKAATGAPAVLVGTHPSALAEQTLAPGGPSAASSGPSGADAVARGEYEYTIRDLARRIRTSARPLDASQWADVPGLSWRDGAKTVHNADRPLIENLDELPFVSGVYRRHLDIRDYFYTIAQYPQVAIVSGRGCPHACNYCVYPQVMHGHKVRRRSVDNLLAEFRCIAAEMPQVREVFIEDDTFTLDKARVLDFSERYRQAGLKLSWVANSRADVDAQTLLALRACNCRLLCVGFESGDQTVLDRMGKRLQVERGRQFCRDARKAGILVHGCFIVGSDGETRDTLAATLSHAKRLPLDTAQFFPLMVYPGTRAYQWAKDGGYLLTEDYSFWTTPEGLHNCVVSRPGLSADELVAFCDRARRRFYLRPRYLLYRLGRLVRHPLEDGPRMWKSFRRFAKFLLWRSRRPGRAPTPQARVGGT